MSLGGSLEDLSLLDILQIVNVSRRTGALRLLLPDSTRSFIYFSSGNVQDIVGDFSEEGFLDFFQSQGLLSPEEMEEAYAKSEGDTQEALKRLLRTGILNKQLLEQARRMELSNRLKSLTLAESGDFDFFLTETGDDLDPEAKKPFYALASPVSPQNLLTQTLTADNFSEWVSAEQGSPPRPETPEPSEPPEEPEEAKRERPMEEVSPPPEAEIPAPAPSRDLVPPPPEPAPPAPPMAAKPESRAYRLLPAKTQVTVLLVSGESIFQELLKRRLLAHFAGVETVADLDAYKAACDRFLASRTPFVALVDLLMPTRSGEGYLGGLEIVQTSYRDFRAVKVVLMSDLKDESLLEVARSHGAVATLQKPGIANLRVDEFEKSIDAFSDLFCRTVDELIPPVEEEVASFYQDLGGETSAPGERIRDQLSLLKGLMGELASPKESSEISLLVLRLAAEYFERAILFLVRKDAYMGLGGFGETGDTEPMIAKVKRLKIPVGEGSVFDEAVDKRVTVLKEEEAYSPLGKDFTLALGAYSPPAMAVLPMISRRKIIALLYGDNAVSGSPLPDLTGIEIFMAQAGIAMEKALLELQLLKARRSIPPGK